MAQGGRDGGTGLIQVYLDEGQGYPEIPTLEAVDSVYPDLRRLGWGVLGSGYDLGADEWVSGTLGMGGQRVNKVLASLLPSPAVGGEASRAAANGASEDEDESEPGTVILEGPDGSRLRFWLHPDGRLEPYPGVRAQVHLEGEYPDFVYVVTGSDQHTYRFDREGRMLERRDPQGNVISFTYSVEGRLTRAYEPVSGRYLDFAYTYFPPGGGTEGGVRLTEAHDPSGRSVHLGYDVAGDLAVVTDTRGLAWTYTYTGSHLLEDVVDPAGHVVERTAYDEEGRAVAQWDGLGNVLQLDYSTGLTGTTVITDARGHVRQDLYVPAGVWGAQADPLGGATSRAYDANFNLTGLVDQNGNTTHLEWSECGCAVESVTDALSQTTAMEYDERNNLTAHTDAADHITRYAYDEHNNLISTTNSLSGTVLHGYDEYGHAISTTDELGHTTLYGYDELGQRAVVTDALGHVTTYGYDAAGRLVTTTVGVWEYGSVGVGRVTVNEYDDGDNLVRVTRNFLAGYPQNWQETYNLVAEYGYDEVGRRVVTTDTLGHVTRSEYDAAGRLVRSTQNYFPGQPQNWQETYNLVTEYGYDEVGNQALVTGTLGHVTYTEYDELNRVVRTWRYYLPGYPQNWQDEYNLVTEYGYDAVGNQALVTDTLGNVIFTEYDELNRVVRTWQNYLEGYPQNWEETYNLVTEYEYDEVGNQIQISNPKSQITKYEYDELNRPVTVTTNYVDGVFDPSYPDEDLVRVTIYDDAGRTAQTMDYASRITHYEYDELGRQVAVTQNYEDGVYDPAQPDRDVRSETIYDELGQVAARVQVADEQIATTYEYDAAGRLITTTNALSGTTVTRYDALGRRVETIDAEGNPTCYEYDAAGRPVTTTNALSGTVVATYDALGRRVAQADPLGHTTVYTYDAAGRLVEQRISGQQRIQYGYDALGHRTVVTDADDVAVYSAYDTLGRLSATADALGNSTEYAYDALGKRVVMTDANSIATRYEYDDVGRLVAVTEDYTTTGLSDHQTNVRTEYGYDVSGNMVAVQDALTHTTVYTYDLAGRRVAEADPLGNVTRYEYDGHGRRVGEAYPDEGGPITVTLGYNTLGWPTQIEYPAVGDVPGFSVEYSYDALGHRSAVTDATGSTTYDYDALYQPLGIEAPTGDTHYEYDAAGQRTHLVYPSGEVVTYTHDAAGRLHTVTDWEGGLTVYTYTAAGRLSGMLLPNSVETHYEYNAAGRLVEIEHSQGGELLARYEYELDGVGNRTMVTETVLGPAGAEAIDFRDYTLTSYGGAGQDITPDNYEILDEGHTLHLWGNTWKALDLDFDVTPGTVLEFDFKSETPAGEVEIVGIGADATPDSIASSQVFKLHGFQAWGYPDFVYTGDGDWQHFAIPIGEFFTEENAYLTFVCDDDVGQTCDGWYRDVVISGGDSTPPSPPTNLRVPGLPAPLPSVARDEPVSTTRIITYTYDPLNRLLGAEYSTGEQFEYAYDGVGNRTAMTTTEGTTAYTFDAANRLTSVGGVTYTWDARGNLLSDGTFTYTYNAAGRMVRAESLDATLVYTYTADGLRVAQSVDGDVTTFAWDLAAPLAQVLATSDDVLNLYGLTRIGEVRDGERAYSLGDALGSVRQWADNAGNVTYAGGYTPFGVEMWQEGSSASTWGYTGEWQDPNVGMVYLRARWYAQRVGRFTQPDPWPGGPQQPLSLHAYIYGFQNPLKYVDPSGTQPYAPILEALREKAGACYNAGDLDCVWWCYWSLAAGGGFFGEPIGKPHASRHLFQFLYKWGDLDWGTESDWVFRSPSVQAEMPSINEEILSGVHTAARGGEMSGHAKTEFYPIAADSDTESDLYYAMFRFSVWAEADFKARLLGCRYLVTIAPTYYFADDYNWHKGLAAGGGIPGVGKFKDEWATALHDHGLALEFKVQGHRDSYFTLLYPHNWLDADCPAPIFALPVSLME